MVHHSDRGSQDLPITCAERPAGARIDPSVGAVGDSCDNALAECGIGLFKAELIHRRAPWRAMCGVAWQTLGWIDWHHDRRLLAPIGCIPPAEAAKAYFATIKTLDQAA